MKRVLSALLTLAILCGLLTGGVCAASGEISRSYGLGGDAVEYHNDFTGLHITASTDWFFTNNMEVAYLYYDDIDPEKLAAMTHKDFKKLATIYDIGAGGMESQDFFDIVIYNLNHKSNKSLRKEVDFVKYLKKSLGGGSLWETAAYEVELTEQRFTVLTFCFEEFTRSVAYQWRGDGYAVVVQVESYEVDVEDVWALFNGGTEAEVPQLPAFGSYNSKKRIWTDETMGAQLTVPKKWETYDRYEATGNYHANDSQWAEDFTEEEWAQLDYIIDFYANSANGGETIAIGYLNMGAMYPGDAYEDCVGAFLFEECYRSRVEEQGTVTLGDRTFEVHKQTFLQGKKGNVRYHLLSQVDENYTMWVYFWSYNNAKLSYYTKMFK